MTINLAGRFCNTGILTSHSLLHLILTLTIYSVLNAQIHVNYSLNWLTGVIPPYVYERNWNRDKSIFDSRMSTLLQSCLEASNDALKEDAPGQDTNPRGTIYHNTQNGNIDKTKCREEIRVLEQLPLSAHFDPPQESPFPDISPPISALSSHPPPVLDPANAWRWWLHINEGGRTSPRDALVRLQSMDTNCDGRIDLLEFFAAGVALNGQAWLSQVVSYTPCRTLYANMGYADDALQWLQVAVPMLLSDSEHLLRQARQNQRIASFVYSTEMWRNYRNVSRISTRMKEVVNRKQCELSLASVWAELLKSANTKSFSAQFCLYIWPGSCRCETGKPLDVELVDGIPRLVLFGNMLGPSVLPTLLLVVGCGGALLLRTLTRIMRWYNPWYVRI